MGWPQYTLTRHRLPHIFQWRQSGARTAVGYKNMAVLSTLISWSPVDGTRDSPFPSLRTQCEGSALGHNSESPADDRGLPEHHIRGGQDFESGQRPGLWSVSYRVWRWRCQLCCRLPASFHGSLTCPLESQTKHCFSSDEDTPWECFSEFCVSAAWSSAEEFWMITRGKCVISGPCGGFILITWVKWENSRNCWFEINQKSCGFWPSLEIASFKTAVAGLLPSQGHDEMLYMPERCILI